MLFMIAMGMPPQGCAEAPCGYLPPHKSMWEAQENDKRKPFLLEHPCLVEEDDVWEIEGVPYELVLDGESVAEFGGSEGGVAYLTTKCGLKTTNGLFETAFVDRIESNYEVCWARIITHKGT